MTRRMLSRAMIGAALLAVGCRDATSLATPADPGPEPPGTGARTLAVVECTGSAGSPRLACREVVAGGGASRAILGSNGAKLTSSNVSYDSVTQIFGFDVTLRNLLAEPIGTRDGLTALGSKVFYAQGPTITAYVSPGDTGSISVANAEGRADFLGADQPYHFYPSLLQPGETSPAKRWELRMPVTVQSFSFLLYVFTPTPGEPRMPAEAPDSVPEALYAPANVAENLPAISGRFVRDVVTVMFRPDATLEERQAALDHVGGTVVGGVRYPLIEDVYFLRVQADSTGQRLLNAIDRLNALPQVEGATPEFVDGPESLDYARPVDGPLYRSWKLEPAPIQPTSYNWGLEAIAAPHAWGCETGNPEMPVTIMDSNFRLDVSQDLVDNMEERYHEAMMGMGDGSHGNLVASVAAAQGNNGTQITGVMWDAALHLVEGATNDLGWPTLQGGAPIIRNVPDKVGVAVAATPGRVINVSAGLSFNTAKTAQIMAGNHTQADLTAAQLYARGLARLLRAHARVGRKPLIVFSAGNEGMDAFWNGFPQLLYQFADQVLVVANAEHVGPGNGFQGGSMRRGALSNVGTLIDVAAPGTDIGAITGLGTPGQRSGTSLAAPVVTGVAGLLFSFDPRLTTAEVKDLILRGAMAGGERIDTGPGLSVPVVNAYESLKLAAQRPGAPLCGTRVWAKDGSVVALRDSATKSTETLLTPGGPIWELNVLHGGKTIVVAHGDEYEYSTFRWSPSGWAADASTPGEYLPPGSGGSALSWAGFSHDWGTGADTTVSVSNPSSTPSSAVFEVAFDASGVRYGTTPLTVPRTLATQQTYCMREYLGPNPAPAGDYRREAYRVWVMAKGYDRNPCAALSEYATGWRMPTADFAAYSPFGDRAIVVVNYEAGAESRTATFTCTDQVRLAATTSTGGVDSFTVNVDYRCGGQTLDARADGRLAYSVPVPRAGVPWPAPTPLPVWAEPDANITYWAISENGREWVADYAHPSRTSTFRWIYDNADTRWILQLDESEERPCTTRFQKLDTGFEVHSVAACNLWRGGFNSGFASLRTSFGIRFRAAPAAGAGTGRRVLKDGDAGNHWRIRMR